MLSRHHEALQGSGEGSALPSRETSKISIFRRSVMYADVFKHCRLTRFTPLTENRPEVTSSPFIATQKCNQIDILWVK
jgi:hypothetical protein